MNDKKNKLDGQINVFSASHGHDYQIVDWRQVMREMMEKINYWRMVAKYPNSTATCPLGIWEERLNKMATTCNVKNDWGGFGSAGVVELGWPGEFAFEGGGVGSWEGLWSWSWR